MKSSFHGTITTVTQSKKNLVEGNDFPMPSTASINVVESWNTKARASSTLPNIFVLHSVAASFRSISSYW